MDSLFSFPVGLFHPLQHAGLPRRTPVYRQLCATSTANSRKAEEVRNCLTDEGRPLAFDVWHCIIPPKIECYVSTVLRITLHYKRCNV